MLYPHMVDNLLQRGAPLRLKVLENGHFYALTQTAGGVPIKDESLLNA